MAACADCGDAGRWIRGHHVRGVDCESRLGIRRGRRLVADLGGVERVIGWFTVKRHTCKWCSRVMVLIRGTDVLICAACDGVVETGSGPQVAVVTT